MKKTKVLLLNQGHTPNYGDIAINHTLELFLNENNINTDFFPFWSEQKVFGKNYDNFNTKIKKLLFKFNFVLDFFNKLSIRKIKKHLNDYNAIIIGGGELIGPHKGFNSSLKIWSNLAQKHKIPLYIFGVSGDLNMSKTMLNRNKKSLKKASFICVRDEYSHEIFTNFYNVNNICMTDVVFAYNKFLKPEKTTPERDSLLFVPIEFNNTLRKKLNLKNETEYMKYLLNFMNNNLTDIKNVIITTSVSNDNYFAEKFYKYAKENSNTNIKFSYFEYTNIQDYIRLLKRSKVVVSARMHALILALLNNCKISVIPFKEKLITFEKNYSNCTNIENIEKIAIEELELLYNLIKSSKHSENTDNYIPQITYSLPTYNYIEE